LSEAKLLEPGAVYEYAIEAGVTGNVFKKRAPISSSNCPRFDRNPNTGNDYGLADELRTAHQTVYHSKAYPSNILLPVIPGH